MKNEQLDDKVVNPQPEVTVITLHINEVNIVLAGLQELPHKISDAVIRNIYEQVNSQLAPQT